MILGGQFKQSGREGYAFAVAEGFRGFGPLIYAELMSYGRDPWVFQSSIAERLGCCVRTVQRWLSHFREQGLLQCWRGKKGEIPPGAKGPIRCGWSHRSMTAWHAAGAAFKAAVERIAARRAERLEARKGAHGRYKGWTARQIDEEAMKRLGMTAAEISAELERCYGPEPPD